MSNRGKRFAGVAVAALMLATGPARAEELALNNYGGGPTGMPYAVALAMGFFKDAGIDITGIRTSVGGGADVRNLVAGDLLWAKSTIGPVVAAREQGVDLKVAADMLNNASSNIWVVMPDSPIKGPKDFKGRKIGYTAPQSATQASELWALQKLGYKDGDVTMVQTGGFGPGQALMEHGGIDVAVLTEPAATLDRSKYRVVMEGGDASIFPAFVSGLGVVSAKQAERRPQAVRAIIEGRRRGVDYMNTHRAEAAAIISKAFKFDARAIQTMFDNLFDHGTVDGVPFYSEGDLSRTALDNGVTMSRLVGVITKDVDYNDLVDMRYLPDDLRAKSKM